MNIIDGSEVEIGNIDRKIALLQKRIDYFKIKKVEARYGFKNSEKIRIDGRLHSILITPDCFEPLVQEIDEYDGHVYQPNRVCFGDVLVKEPNNE